MYQTASLSSCRLVGSYLFIKYSVLGKNVEKMKIESYVANLPKFKRKQSSEN